MFKKLLLALFLLCVFSSQATAQVIPRIPVQPLPENAPAYSPNQLIVSFKKEQSPTQLKKIISTRKEETKHMSGFINNAALVITGQRKPLSFYQQKLQTINNAYKTTHVIKQSYIEYPWGTTAKLTLKDGTNLSEAAKTLKQLPEVQNVNFNYYKYTSGISAIDNPNLSPITPNAYVIQYKSGQTPQSLQQEVDKRQDLQASKLGTARIAAENLSAQLSGEQLPETRLNRINQVLKAVGKQDQQSLLDNPSTKAPQELKNTVVITTNGSTDTTETIAQLAALPEVENVRPVQKAYATATPNDQYYSQQWNYPKIQAPAAWDHAKGSSSVIVAVIDSGVDYNHPDLAGRVTQGPNYMTGGTPMDDCGHGTHVSGTIGAITNNTVGVAGINWEVQILAIKSLGDLGGECGTMDDTTITQGITYAADHGAKVINMSLGGRGACPFDYQQAIDYARSKNITVVVAAGNSGQNASTFNPANCNGTITVGATDQSDRRSVWSATGSSNYGSIVSIAAPGTDIPSTYKNPQTGASGYASMGGTSMASPHVAGAAALLLSINSSLTPDQVKSYLVNSADPISTDLPIGPRLNLQKAVEAVGGGSGITPSPSPTPGGPTDAPTPTGGTVPTPTGTPQQPTPTPTPVGSLLISVNVPGIGPGQNLNPQPFTKNATVDFIGQNGTSVAQKKINMTFQNNTFSGVVPLDGIPSGTYQIKITVEYTLAKLASGFYTIAPTTTSITLPTVTLTSGDINKDGVLDILDYNILVGNIQSGTANPGSDLNNDTAIDAKDLNLFLRQLGNRTGD